VGCKRHAAFYEAPGRNATLFPGILATRLCPDFLSHIGKPERIIAVTGTNGKTTVCNLIDDILESCGIRVLDNRLGSNVEAGVITSLISGSTIFGRSKYQTAVFEIDERSSRRIYPHVRPDFIVITNLFRDSIMRNAHPEYIADIISSSVPASSKLILNGDDLISAASRPEMRASITASDGWTAT
jgi:UDP-N-acetylmuramoylalanine-D-glutamate ligase